MGYMPELRKSSQCGRSMTLAHHYRRTVDLGSFAGILVLQWAGASGVLEYPSLAGLVYDISSKLKSTATGR
jgi:hypothetical protein